MNNWRVFLPEGCTHPLKTGAVCTGCVEIMVNDIFDTLISEITKFDAVVICEGENITDEQKLINEYVKGTLQGYKDARDQILAFVKDLHPKRGIMTDRDYRRLID